MKKSKPRKPKEFLFRSDFLCEIGGPPEWTSEILWFNEYEMYPKEARKLAAWLIKASEYLDSKNEKN